ncbi:MAG: hypothetical protein IJT96_07885 [Lachnospiraceae bacterium]|nr:hypothetical protein [Lachnospiraceae bacterium]
MTYKLNPEIEKIISPVVVTDGKNRWEFANGRKAEEAVFDKQYNITSYRAMGDTVEVSVEEFRV